MPWLSRHLKRNKEQRHRYKLALKIQSEISKPSQSTSNSIQASSRDDLATAKANESWGLKNSHQIKIVLRHQGPRKLHPPHGSARPGTTHAKHGRRCDGGGSDDHAKTGRHQAELHQVPGGKSRPPSTSQKDADAPKPAKFQWRTNGEQSYTVLEWLVAGRLATKSSLKPNLVRSVSGSLRCRYTSLRRSTRPSTMPAGTRRCVRQRQRWCRSLSRRGRGCDG